MNETPNTEPEDPTPAGEPTPTSTNAAAPEGSTPIDEQAQPTAATEGEAPTPSEVHPANAVLDEIHQNLNVQMNVGWLRKKLEQVRGLL